MNNKTGEIIEKHRKEKKLTQEELANKLGVSKSAISKWENGNNLPDITLLEPLSEILGIDKLLLFTSENAAKEEISDRVKIIKRKNYFKAILISTAFIFSIIFTNYITYKSNKHKLSMIEDNQTVVYRFYSTDEEYYVNGYIIFQDNQSTIVFDKLEVQKKNERSIKDKIKSAELHFYVNDTAVLKSTKSVSENNSNDINHVLQDIMKNSPREDLIELDKENLNNLFIKLIINKDKEITYKDIKLAISNKI